MKHSATLLYADRKMNDLLRRFDLFIPGKVLVSLVEIEFQTTTSVNEEYFMKMIDFQAEIMKASYGDDLFLSGLAGVIYMDNIFVHPCIKILSDGKHEMFISKNL